jgi:hypothetical protein
MKSQRKFILNVILLLLLGVISLGNSYFLNFFLEISDGAAYSAAYEKISGLDIIDGYENFIVYTGGAEPLSFLLFYLFSKFTSIKVFNWILNTVLLFVVFKFLYKQRIKVFIFFPFIITNYYLLILEFGILRLKIAIIFWFLSLLAKTKEKSNFYFLFAFLSHFQIALILLIRLLVEIIIKKDFKIKLNYIVIFLIIITFLFEKILGKFLWYYNTELYFPYKTILFFIPMIFVVNRLKFLSITFIIFFSLAIFIGEERILILLFFLLISEYILFANRDFIRGAVLVVYCFYFSVKGVIFALSLIEGVSYFL